MEQSILSVSINNCKLLKKFSVPRNYYFSMNSGEHWFIKVCIHLSATKYFGHFWPSHSDFANTNVKKFFVVEVCLSQLTLQTEHVTCNSYSSIRNVTLQYDNCYIYFDATLKQMKVDPCMQQNKPQSLNDMLSQHHYHHIYNAISNFSRTLMLPDDG